MTTSLSVTDHWVERLSNPVSQTAALSDLRVVLMHALDRAFHDSAGGHCFCEDIAQESLVRILQKLHLFSGRSRFTTWAVSVAVRVGFSELRQRPPKHISLDQITAREHLKFDMPDNQFVAVDIMEGRQAILETLRKLIDHELTERQRQATKILLHGLPMDDIAAQTDSNRNAVYKLVHDARSKLKAGLENAGYTADDVLSAFT